MGIFNLDNFLAQLATTMQTVGGTSSINYSGTPRTLWRYQAVEGAQCGDPYSVLVPYTGGEIGWVPTATVPIQILTVGSVMSAAVNRANLIMQLFLDSQGRPKQMIDLGGNYRLIGVRVRPPANLPPDGRGRGQVVINLDALAANVS